MKSLKIADLRGTNTAIHCPTQADWDKVTEIAGYRWSTANWSDYITDTCITLDKRTNSDIGYLKSKGFTIIPAADFIAANTEAEQVEIKEGDVWVRNGQDYVITCVAIDFVVVLNKLTNVSNNHSLELFREKYTKKPTPDPSNPLPPLPSEGVEAERVEAEKTSEYVTKTEFKQSFEELSERLKAFLAKETKESFEKWLSENRAKSATPDTTEPAISQTPAEVKLPVTIEEVFSGAPKGSKSYVIQSNGNIGEFEFNEIERVDEYRKESTAKRVRAFMILQAISEAQNEIAPRGEVVWFAELEISKDKIGMINETVATADYGYGLIAFHSEQGLKDCIEANRELWMDLLKGEQQ